MNYSQHIPFSKTKITGGFWKTKQDLNKEVTANAVYNRFSDTYRFDALKCKPVNENSEYQPHIYWDSDVAKWLEGIAYMMAQYDVPELEKLAEDAISDIINSQMENGYYNCHYQVMRPEEIFTDRNNHELYCAGHLFEAAVAHYEATGKDYFLNSMCRYADYIYKVFVEEKSAKFVTCGHPEIELALVKRYKATGNEKYLELSRFFIDNRGNNDIDGPVNDVFNKLYDQSDRPLRELTTADGHSVRALYIYSAMADLAKTDGDNALLNACRRVFDNMVNKRMYITGGLGSTHLGECFTIDYHMPNRTAYNETCASIAMVLFARRMLEIEPDSRYADVIERELYNGILSGWSLDGESFFYENPLEITPQFANASLSTHHQERVPIMERQKVFGCSCCPPNIVRFIASVADYIYSDNDDTLFVHQYMQSETETEKGKLSITTNYPSNGDIAIRVSGGYKTVALRIPSWCDSFTINKEYTIENGYAYVTVSDDDEIKLSLEMTAKIWASNPQVHENAGRVAVSYGPVVYCAESVDNGDTLTTIRVAKDTRFTPSENSAFGLPVLKATVSKMKPQTALYLAANSEEEAFDLTLIPYSCFANRGVAEMLVWLIEK